jgi:hypothetical protein
MTWQGKLLAFHHGALPVIWNGMNPSNRLAAFINAVIRILGYAQIISPTHPLLQRYLE